MTRQCLSGSVTLAAWLFAGGLSAEPVYKSVDESGNVTYSDAPSEGAITTESVEVPPGPSDEALEKARKEVQDVSKRADEMEQKRLEKEEARRSKERQALEQPRTEPAVEGVTSPRPAYWYPTAPSRPRDPNPQGYESGGGDHPAYSPGIPAARPAPLAD